MSANNDLAVADPDLRAIEEAARVERFPSTGRSTDWLGRSIETFSIGPFALSIIVVRITGNRRKEAHIRIVTTFDFFPTDHDDARSLIQIVHIVDEDWRIGYQTSGDGDKPSCLDGSIIAGRFSLNANAERQSLGNRDESLKTIGAITDLASGFAARYK